MPCFDWLALHKVALSNIESNAFNEYQLSAKNCTQFNRGFPFGFEKMHCQRSNSTFGAPMENLGSTRTDQPSALHTRCTCADQLTRQLLDQEIHRHTDLLHGGVHQLAALYVLRHFWQAKLLRI